MDVTDIAGVPTWLPDHLAEAGVEELYPPQAEAVEAGVMEGRNLVASVPTASGKTLIAVLAMLASIRRGGMALYIVPLRALASEKREEFATFEAHGIDVGVSTGNYDSSEDWLGSRDLVVATSEKVDSLVRNDASWLAELSCAVADEIHLVDDPERGPTLEVTLAKLRRQNPDLQTVALSATIGNADELADWLDAELIDSDWRPVDLRKGVHYGQSLHFEDGSQRQLAVRDAETPTAAIARDTATEGGSSLVFVNSRRNAEAAASRLAPTIAEQLTDQEAARLASVAEDVRSVTDTDTTEDLADAVQAGAAFHHAGLAPDHRSLVEEAFQDRLLKVVAATPTLAAGVNTPSRRVVVRDWRRYSGDAGGMQPLSVLEVHQMMGRAGRPGLDPYGEAVLLADSHDELDELFERYVWARPEPVRSKLAAEPALRTHLLSTVAAGIATTRGDLLSFLERTLYAAQTENRDHLAAVTDDVLAYLMANDFLERDDGTLAATSLGETVSRLYLDPMSAAEIVDGLRDAEEPSALGLYQLVCRTPDMYRLYLRSGEREEYTMTAYERETEFLGPVPSEFEDAFETWLSALKTGRLLEDWADEVDEAAITDRYGVGPGDVRGKVDTAEWLLRSAEGLASQLDLGIARQIRTARKRVADGVREELIDLAEVRGVGRARARRLYDAGIHTRADLREADKSVVLAALRGRRRTAERILENAGREDASLDGVEPAPGTAAATDTTEETPDGQADLGEF